MELTWWNKKTYDDVKKFISKGERCAITNATGTGKTSVITTFIKEFGKNKNVLVIAPRKPILDQYKNPMYGLDQMNNIQYITFSKLGRLFSSGELDENDEFLSLGIIIIDELHRSGAKTWLPAIDKLILNNRDAYIVGASATPRRSDQKYDTDDMIDIIFDGNRCGEFDLKTCIRKGILPTPIYVSTLYSINEEQNKLLEKADSLDEIDKLAFEDEIKESVIKWDETKNKERAIQQFLTFRNMDKRTTKILVFCKNIDHVAMIRKEFDPIFEKVYKDQLLNITEYHSRVNNKGFEEFKDIEMDGLVQILYTVDKFNEGIHIDGLDGIIMLRETESEIIYYQQLGRVLSLSGRDNPVIIDIVNNSNKIQADDTMRDLMEEYTSFPVERGPYNKPDRDIPVGFYNYVKDINELFNSIERRIIEKSQYEYNGEKGTYKYFADKYNRDPKIIYSKVKINKMSIAEAIETTEELSGIEVEWEGTKGTLEEVCNKFRVNHALVKYRMDNRGMSFKEAMESVIKK